jgi:hypothetical protein
MAHAAFPSGRKLLFLLALAATIGGAWWWQRPPPEPVYNGLSLSEWLARPGPILLGNSRNPEAQIHAFGPATIPWLTFTLEHSRKPFVRRGPLPLDKAPVWLRRWAPERWGGLRTKRAFNERLRAAEALNLLNEEAAPAIPALARSLQSDDLQLVQSAAAALKNIGSAAWPAMEEALAHGSVPAKVALLEWPPGHLGPIDFQRIPAAMTVRVLDALLAATRDPERNVRAAALNAISSWNFNLPMDDLFEQAIPDLIRLLSDSAPEIRRAAAFNLANFQDKAGQAIPRLRELLGDPSPEVREMSAHALRRIEPKKQR